ncbi:alanyl-tRNA synthetase family protein [Trichomonas vaginalis G3]|uniref:Alanine--tRNA ligase n=3 Tax=Trichomonas vaginalis TaxID=5722 RepID=A2EVS2_TRIV3|nr:alanyl-tRNA synthetase [Trichomonas vaginalis G3]EAY03282.1 alanyl-tRNA synthetase family protein [Trichomonas vaginalis G3]KAI5535563.1 alanyl-tRNA synthetase [Trichomonas vaginalis G3]|eukprot:XP_001315505.1 alanyl-tRNA synthetase family protein [Trichomonas vaginalis G3]
MSKEEAPQVFNLTPSEVKAKARKYFAELRDSGRNPWPYKFLTSQGFHQATCKHCHKKFWTADPNREDCGDSECAGGYSFLHPDEPPKERVTYLQAWLDFKKSMETNTPVPYTAIKRYPVVCRWRSDVDFVAAGIYCFQPFCVTGESEPPANPLCACQFCLRFNDLDNIGITGRHYSGFNMLGIQVFNHADRARKEPNQFGETEEIFWKDTLIANNYRWCTETLHLDPKKLTFIEDVWAGGGNCGACVEYFYGGLEIGNMVFTEYTVSPQGEFSPISTKVVDVGIGLERIPWLVNGGWTSYLDVFDYILPVLSQKLDVPIDTPEFRKFAPNTALFDADENQHIEQTWAKVGEEMGLDKAGLAKFRQHLRQFSDLVRICDHTRTVLYAIEDGALPSNNGGAANIRDILRIVFDIIKKHNWLGKIGGVDGIIDVFKAHMKGLEGFFGPFSNTRCLEDVIRLEFTRWENSHANAIKLLKSFVNKWRGKEIPVQEWITQMTSNGVSADEIIEAFQVDDPNSQLQKPDDLYIKLEEYKCRTAKGIELEKYNVEGIPDTEEIYNYPENEYKYEGTAKLIKLLAPNKLVFDRTILYPTQGGQEHDDGKIKIGDKLYEVQNIEKVRKVAIFTVDGDVDEKYVNTECTMYVDPEVREIMRTQHSATHLVAAAARRVLGPHVWQNGAKKTKVESHIDLTHYSLPTFEQVLEIQRVANELIMTNAAVKKCVYTRKEAEDKWGFVLYQGGAIPGNDIRVVDIGGIDTEACCGTHVSHLSEIGQIRILGVNSVQDGVFRCTFVAGKLAIKAACEDMRLIHDVCTVYGCQQSDIMMNCNKFFAAKNSLTSQNKALTDQVISLLVKCCAYQPGDKHVVIRSEENGTSFIKGIDEACKQFPEMANKSILVQGPTYIVGMVQQDIADKLAKEINAAFEPLNAQSKKEYDEQVKKMKEEGVAAANIPKYAPACQPFNVIAPKKSQQKKKNAKAAEAPASTAVSVMTMKIAKEVFPAVKDILSKFGFTQ